MLKAAQVAEQMLFDRLVCGGLRGSSRLHAAKGEPSAPTNCEGCRPHGQLDGVVNGVR